MESSGPGKPLAFLDHRIGCGNALPGTTSELLAKGVPDDAFKPLTGDDRTVVTSLRNRNRAERAGQGTLDFGNGSDDLRRTIAAGYAAIDEIADDDVAGLAAKERSEEHTSELQSLMRISSAVFCLKKTKHK